MGKQKNTQDFICEAIKVHGLKYDYSKVEYINSKTKVCIICPVHGEFWQIPNSHLLGHGCNKCGIEAKANNLSENSRITFKESANKIHDGYYCYDKVKYVNSKVKVCIICPVHGEFWQNPHDHLSGEGCSMCGREKTISARRMNTEEFKIKANEIHGKKYNYDHVIYVNNNTHVNIICPKHGEFRQTPHGHLRGSGCPKCGFEQRHNSQFHTQKEVETKANLIHEFKYEYGEYLGNKIPMKIICPIHGEFWQTPHDHLQGSGCPKCGYQTSKAEDEIMSLLAELSPKQRNRVILSNKEIDIYIPSLKLGIEYNGLRWHSEEFGKDSHYHVNKLNECNTQGINLIHIFEDEWLNHKEICESKLKHICGIEQYKSKIFARKCQIHKIDNKEAKSFLVKNHIQGHAPSTVYLGAFYDNNLIGVMTFKKEKEGHWDLNRFATDINYNCIGVGGKLFKYFIKNYQFVEIKSFADRRWTTNPTNNLYTKLGFEFVEFTRPDYRYYDKKTNERHHKFGFRKQILHKRYGLPLTMTEYEMTQELGFHRIWDCGLIKYKYTNKNAN